MPTTDDANAWFEARWEQVQKKRIVIGEEDKGVEIVFDADLSLFGLAKKLKELSRSSHEEGLLSDKDHKAVIEGAEQCERVLAERLRGRLGRLLGNRD